jgi:hypothetical protein
MSRNHPRPRPHPAEGLRKVFVSYAREDAAFADRLYNALLAARTNGISRYARHARVVS